MEHMCTRCARTFLQNTRIYGHPLATSRVRPFSNVSSRFAKAPWDLSQPLESYGTGPSSASAASQDSRKPKFTFRKINPNATKPSGSPIPEGRTRKTVTAPPPAGQLLQRSSKPSSLRAQAGTPAAANTLTQTRGPPPSSSHARKAAVDENEVDEEFDEDEDNKEEEDDEFESKEEEIVALKEALAAENIGEFHDSQILVIRSRLKLLTDETISEEDRSMLEKLAEPESFNELSLKQVNYMAERLNLFAESPAEIAERTSATQHMTLDTLTETQRRAAEQLSDANFDNLTYAEKLAAANELDIVAADGSILEPAEARKRFLVKQLSDENIDKLTDDEKSDIVHELGLVAEDGKTLLDPTEKYGYLLQSFDPEDEYEISDEERADLDKLTNDNIGKLSEKELAEVASRLDLIGEDGRLLDPSRYPYSRASFTEDATAARERRISEEEDAKTASAEEEAEEAPREGAWSFTDEEMGDFQKLSDKNINKLPPEEIQAAMARLGLIGENGEVLDMHEVFASRVVFPEDNATENAAEEDDYDGEEDREKGSKLELTEDEEVEKFVDTVLDPSPLSLEALPYEPQEYSTEELRKDWPNTPLSGPGLTESVIQKVTWLANRLPHGHWTPSQIAERYEEGYMVRFASEQEKETVLKLAAGLANARADKLTERTGEAVEAQDMSFSGLMSEEKQGVNEKVLGGMTRGVYPRPEKQNRAFLDGVVRQLENNETYKPEDSSKFVGRVQKLIAQISGGGGKGQAR